LRNKCIDLREQRRCQINPVISGSKVNTATRWEKFCHAYCIYICCDSVLKYDATHLASLIGFMQNKADTCRRSVAPTLLAAGWDNDPHSIAEQRTFTDGRIVVRKDKGLNGDLDRLPMLAWNISL
jgi:hypothetical protein